MTSYYVELIFDMGAPFDEEMDNHLDQIAEALTQIPDVDGDVGSHANTGRVEICITVDAVDRPDAIAKAFVAARTAVHAAGGGTHGWENWLPKLLEADDFTTSVSRSSVAAC